jgi:very-short-patch-repair endonuclease
MEKSVKKGEVEKKLDDMVRKYTARKPMKGVSYNVSKKTWRLCIRSEDFVSKSKNDMIELGKEYMEEDLEDLDEYQESDFKKREIIQGQNILIGYEFNKTTYYDIAHILNLICHRQNYVNKKGKILAPRINKYFWHVNEFGGYLYRKLITVDDVKYLICKSRSSKNKNVADMLNIAMFDFKEFAKEELYINMISKAFHIETHSFQYNTGKYRIDLYFPKYQLGIECDEFGHADRNQEHEKKRERDLKKMGISLIRFNPDSPNFDIFDAVSEIYTFIKHFKSPHKQ